jgi:hypothetical protein
MIEENTWIEPLILVAGRVVVVAEEKDSSGY